MEPLSTGSPQPRSDLHSSCQTLALSSHNLRVTNVLPE